MEKQKVIHRVFLIPILFCGWLLVAGCSDSNPETGVNEPSVDWLPPSASNVSYHKEYTFKAYEFSISEEGFKAWLDERTPSEIVEPVMIERYNYPIEFFANSENTKTIANGLYWRTPPRGNGGGTYFAYDRDSGTAYYRSSPR